VADIEREQRESTTVIVNGEGPRTNSPPGLQPHRATRCPSRRKRAPNRVPAGLTRDPRRTPIQPRHDARDATSKRVSSRASSHTSDSPDVRPLESSYAPGCRASTGRQLTFALLAWVGRGRLALCHAGDHGPRRLLAIAFPGSDRRARRGQTIASATKDCSTGARSGQALCPQPDRQLPKGCQTIPLATSHEGRALVNNDIGVALVLSARKFDRTSIGCRSSRWWCGPIAEVFVDLGRDRPEPALAVFAHDDVHLA
jgi:hypothetical protein